MGTSLIVKIGDQEYITTTNREGQIQISETDFIFEEFYQVAPNCYFVKINGKNEFVAVVPNGEGKFKINFRGFNYDVETYDPLQKYLKQMAKSSEKESSSLVRITAPMPGLIVKILCQEGSVINKGDKAVLIEAMKMENALLSPISGYVKKIYVSEGIPVEKGETLVEISAQ